MQVVEELRSQTKNWEEQQWEVTITSKLEGTKGWGRIKKVKRLGSSRDSEAMMILSIRAKVDIWLLL